MNMLRSMRRKKVRTMMEKQGVHKPGKKLKVWWNAYLEEEAKAAHRRKLAKGAAEWMMIRPNIP